MIIFVDEAVFSSPRSSPLGLLAVFRACFEGQHTLVTDPPFVAGASQAVDGWLGALPAPLLAEVQFVLDEGPAEVARRTAAATAMRVGDVERSDYRGPVPVVTLADAVRIAQTPLRLLVENRRNDGAFLRTIAPPAWRSKLLSALQDRWIEFENGGGIGEMPKRIGQAAEDPRDHLRLWVMVDSDAREPDAPSEQSEAVLTACQTAVHPCAVPIHRLARRAIENYLPVRALLAWAELARREEKTRRRRCAEAFGALTPQQRAHYNMKEGLLRDLPKRRRDWYEQHEAEIIDAAELSALFAGLSEEARRRLRDGFGEDVCSLFHDGEPRARVEEEWLRREISDHERATLLQSIFDRM